MTTLWFDCETYSECDLKAHGTPRYAEHPSTEITVAQWAFDEGEPVVEDLSGRARASDQLLDLMHSAAVDVTAHNSVFDRTLARECWGINVPVHRWRDTMVKALAHGLPGGLDKIGQVLGLEADQAKDKRGRDLIYLFCRPRPGNAKLRRATRETHPAEWAEFLAYSRQDIVAMRAIDRLLPKWNYRDGHAELALWHLDQTINDRGVAVDVHLAQAAITATTGEKKRLDADVHDLTDGEVSAASKRDQLLKHIVEHHGVTLPDFKADTLRRRVEDPELPEAVRLLLAIRLEATKTSTAKYRALVNATSTDGRLRNTLQFAGAQRTGRWAGRTFQPQNMPRPDMKQSDIDDGIAALKAGCADLFFKDVMRLTANAVRGCIVAPPGRKLVVADLSNIEGRMLAWLAGEEWKLQAFRGVDAGVGPDLYKLAYARSFGTSPDFDHKTVEGHMQRQIGKVMELGLGYEGGVAAFLTFAAVYRMDLEAMADAVHGTAPKAAMAAAYGVHEWATRKGRSTFGLPTGVYVACEVLKAAWREAHPATVALWRDVGNAVRSAIQHPGTTFDVRALRVRRDGAWLRVMLPSGRYLCYLQPKLDGNDITYMGVNQYTKKWGRIKTYGGKLVENITQAAARDVLAANMPRVEERGYQIVLTVHDENLTETPDTDDYSADELAALMSTVPAWAPGLPLAAAGFETTRYRKD
jgi:DNA polymerase